ncbi:hypothetical protein RHS02_04463, partial [Rhizoctonia solani]
MSVSLRLRVAFIVIQQPPASLFELPFPLVSPNAKNRCHFAVLLCLSTIQSQLLSRRANTFQPGLHSFNSDSNIPLASLADVPNLPHKRPAENRRLLLGDDQASPENVGEPSNEELHDVFYNFLALLPPASTGTELV